MNIRFECCRCHCTTDLTDQNPETITFYCAVCNEPHTVAGIVRQKFGPAKAQRIAKILSVADHRNAPKPAVVEAAIESVLRA